MTQEELDALMAGDLDDLGSDEVEKVEESSSEEVAEEVLEEVEQSETEESSDEEVEDIAQEETQEVVAEETEEKEESESIKDAHEYRADAEMAWPPPPPTEDHKMVTQLDDVTRDSEAKATQIFDRLDAVNNVLMDMEEDIDGIVAKVEENISLFEKLVEKFPNIAQFKSALQDNIELKEKIENIKLNAQAGEDEVMMAMDIMQYQDIHRQKIERVINVMRALSKYISMLFEGAIDDDKRVSSAVHIHGDENTEDLVTTDDIEAIIESLGKKK
jgi:hypothetical protein